MAKNHSSRAHAKRFSPSKADTWIDCTSSPAFVESLNLPDKRTKAADEGTAAHELLEASLKAGKHPLKFKGKKFNKTWEATQEMCEFVGYVYEWVQGYVLDGYTLFSETKVNIKVTGDMGTLDLALLKGDHLIVGDLKYGRGYEVSAVKNRQMRLYACGLMDDKNLWHVVKRITLAVAQPRITPDPTTWEDTLEGLTHFRKKVAEIVEAINRGSTVFKPGEKACKWCPAKDRCKAHASFAASLAGMEFDAIVATNGAKTPDCAALTMEQRVAIYQNSSVLTDFLKANASGLLDDALAGTPIPGLKLVESGAKRKWADEDAVLAALASLKFNPDDYAPRSLLGLGAIGGLFTDKQKREKFLDKHAETPKGKPSLVDESDPRPTYVSDEFADLDNL